MRFCALLVLSRALDVFATDACKSKSEKHACLACQAIYEILVHQENGVFMDKGRTRKCMSEFVFPLCAASRVPLLKASEGFSIARVLGIIFMIDVALSKHGYVLQTPRNSNICNSSNLRF